MTTELEEANALMNDLNVPSNRECDGDPCDGAMTLAERITWLVAAKITPQEA